MNIILEYIEIIYDRKKKLNHPIINYKMIKNAKTLFMDNKKQDIKLEDDQTYDLKKLNTSDIDILYNIDISTTTTCLIYFPGVAEEFDAVYKIASFSGSFIICRDRHNNWYKDKQIQFKEIIDEMINTYKLEKIILLGQSMGGYMSLYMSAYYDNSICIAISPQTFNNRRSNILYHSAINEKHPPEHIIDIKKHLTKNISNSKKYIFISESECDDHYKKEIGQIYHSYWDDHLFAEYLINIENVYILVFPKHTHTLFGHINFSESLGIKLVNDFDKLYNDPSTNSKDLLNNLLFKG